MLRARAPMIRSASQAGGQHELSVFVVEEMPTVWSPWREELR